MACLESVPRVPMQILRHSEIAITMEIYTEVASSATREAAATSATSSALEALVAANIQAGGVCRNRTC